MRRMGVSFSCREVMSTPSSESRFHVAPTRTPRMLGSLSERHVRYTPMKPGLLSLSPVGYRLMWGLAAARGDDHDEDGAAHTRSTYAPHTHAPKPPPYPRRRCRSQRTHLMVKEPSAVLKTVPET